MPNTIYLSNQPSDSIASNDEEYQKLLDRAFLKMPKLSAEISDFKIPGADSLIQGNKTVLKNINVIADRARRNVNEIARYISKELATPASLESQGLIINGKFSSQDLDRRIARYFEIYVICKECKKPDSHLDNAGRGMFNFICEACGARYGVKSY